MSLEFFLGTLILGNRTIFCQKLYKYPTNDELVVLFINTPLEHITQFNENVKVCLNKMLLSLCHSICGGQRVVK